jgi:hypothetical protein
MVEPHKTPNSQNNLTAPAHLHPPTPQLFERIVEFCGVLIFYLPVQLELASSDDRHEGFVLYQDKMNIGVWYFEEI